MQLQLSSWPEVEEYLKTSSGMVIPIGSTEQHGPNGLIGTDAICAEAISKGVGDETEALVGPTINVGMALHHTSFPGTVSLRPSTLLLLVQDYITFLTKAGFTKFFFINGHGGNMATVKAAFAQTYTHLSELQIPNSDRVQCRLANWFLCGSVRNLAKELYGDREGSHATASEVAVTQFLYPESIKNVELDPQLPPQDKIYGPDDFRRRHPDGRMGSDPSMATPEQGERFYKAAVQELSQAYREFLQAE